jgi:hypothetical protein
MTSNEQRAALQRKIWDIANDVRGAVDGWDFKQYVLGTLFYRFISENFIDYITGGDPELITPRWQTVIRTSRPPKMTPSRPRATSSTPASCLSISRPTPTPTKA